MQYLNYLTNPTAATDEFRQQQLGQITGEAPAMQNALASAGAGQGAKEGAVASLYNNAQRSANEFDANWNSPQGKAQQAAGVVNLVNSQAPNWGNEQNIASITNNTPRNQTGLQAAMSLGQTAATVFGPKK